jgi:hypothetical protein
VSKEEDDKEFLDKLVTGVKGAMNKWLSSNSGKAWSSLQDYERAYDEDGEELVEENDRRFKEHCRRFVSDEEFCFFMKLQQEPRFKVGDDVSYSSAEMGSLRGTVCEVVPETSEKCRFFLGYSKGWGEHYLVCRWAYRLSGLQAYGDSCVSDYKGPVNGVWLKLWKL